MRKLKIWVPDKTKWQDHVEFVDEINAFSDIMILRNHIHMRCQLLET